MALYTAYAAQKLGGTEGQAAKWWLRSLGTNVMNASFVDEGGKLGDYQSSYLDAADTSTAVRPAFYLDLSALTYLTESGSDKTADFSAAVSLDDGEGAAWCVSVFDGNAGFEAELPESSVSQGGTFSAEILALGESETEYTQLSAVLTGEDETVEAFGKVGEADTGTVMFTIPEEILPGDYQLYIFAEYVNSSGEDGESKTDYSSGAAEFSVSVE